MAEERSINDEVDQALEGLNLQEMDLDPMATPGRAGPKGAEESTKLQRGTVVGIDGDDVIVELGPRMQGVIGVTEFDEPPSIGDAFDFTLAGRDGDLWVLSRKEALTLAALDDLEPGALVKAKVTGQNTGGLELKLSGLSGFMPASHVDVGRVEDLSRFLGEHLVCEVIEVDRGRKRLLLSRRNAQRKELEVERQKAVQELVPGAVVHGKVTRIESYGAFVDIGGGVEGLVHVSNIARERLDSPEDVLKVGQQVDAKVLEIKEGGKRIGLGMKQLLPDPWDDVEDRLRPEQVVQAKVVRVLDFGAFLEIVPGLEGLLHVSQIAGGSARKGRGGKGGPEVGSELTVRVVSVDRIERRISLSCFDSRGAVIGSEEAAGAAEIDQVLDESKNQTLGTNLGNLFKKALED